MIGTLKIFWTGISRKAKFRIVLWWSILIAGIILIVNCTEMYHQLFLNILFTYLMLAFGVSNLIYKDLYKFIK